MATLDSLVPTTADLAQWENIENTEVDFGAPLIQVQVFLQLATDLLVLDTGITEAPDPVAHPALARIIKSGILDMAWYIGTAQAEAEERFSAFSGERIGSYSYNKSFRRGLGTSEPALDSGVPWYDTAIKYLTQWLTDNGTGVFIAVDSENVLGARSYIEYERHLSRDPMAAYRSALAVVSANWSGTRDPDNGFINATPGTENPPGSGLFDIVGGTP